VEREAVPACTLEDAFNGHGLGIARKQGNKRSTFIASFNL
jgi:hypothetical protein